MKSVFIWICIFTALLNFDRVTSRTIEVVKSLPFRQCPRLNQDGDTVKHVEELIYHVYLATLPVVTSLTGAAEQVLCPNHIKNQDFHGCGALVGLSTELSWTTLQYACQDDSFHLVMNLLPCLYNRQVEAKWQHCHESIPGSSGGHDQDLCGIMADYKTCVVESTSASLFCTQQHASDVRSLLDNLLSPFARHFDCS